MEEALERLLRSTSGSWSSSCDKPFAIKWLLRLTFMLAFAATWWAKKLTKRAYDNYIIIRGSAVGQGRPADIALAVLKDERPEMARLKARMETQLLQTIASGKLPSDLVIAIGNDPDPKLTALKERLLQRVLKYGSAGRPPKRFNLN